MPTTFESDLVALTENVTQGPWWQLKHPSDMGGMYSSGHVVSAHHDYAGNFKARKDSITAPDSMTFSDGAFIAACDPEVVKALCEVVRQARGHGAGLSIHNALAKLDALKSLRDRQAAQRAIEEDTHA